MSIQDQSEWVSRSGRRSGEEKTPLVSSGMGSPVHTGKEQRENGRQVTAEDELKRSDLHKNKDFQLINVPQDAVSIEPSNYWAGSV